MKEVTLKSILQRFLLAAGIILACLLACPPRAPAQNPSPPIVITQVFVSATTGPAIQVAGYTNHTLTWSASTSTAVTGCLVQVDAGPTQSGPWTAAGLVASQACNSAGTITVTAVTASWARVNLTTLTAGTVSITYSAVNAAVSKSSGGGGGSGTVAGQVLGQPAQGLTATSIGTSASALFVSAFCGGTLTCPNATDESFAIQAAVTQLQNGGSNGATGHIVDDMCGRQTWSTQPFAGFAGLFEIRSNCSIPNTHVISVDGIGTVTTPSSMTLLGTGTNGFAQVPSNSWIEACNPNINNCLHGGFLVPQAAVTSFTVTGANSVVVLGSAIPITGNGAGVAAPGRELLIAGTTPAQVSNLGAWVIGTTTSTTNMTVGVVSGVTVTCASACAETAYLDTPLIEIGTSIGGAVFGTRIDGVVLNCNYVLGCGGFANGVGQEDSGIGMVQVFNADMYYGRLDQSAAYNGLGTAGATNSGGYGPWAGNINPVLCAHTGGCACVTGSGSGTTGGISNVCTAGLVAVGGTVTCGAGGNTGTLPAVLSPDPCDNPNFVGFAFTGVSGAQGFGDISNHMTVSISDKSIGGGTPIPGLMGNTANFGFDGCVCSVGAQPGSSAATTGVGFFVGGVHFETEDSHAEYFFIDAQIGGNTAKNATWGDFYKSILTSGVLFRGGLWAFQSGGVGADIGSVGNGAFVQDVLLEGMNIGNGGISVNDEVITTTCSDPVITWFHGHGTPPLIYNTCAALSNVIANSVELLGSTSGLATLTTPSTGGTLLGPAGSTTVPGFGFAGNVTTGISAEAANILGLLSNGVLVATITGGVEVGNAASFKASQTGASNGAVGVSLVPVGSGTTEAWSVGGTSTGLFLHTACKVTATVPMTVSGTPVTFCTFTLPNAAGTWSWQCSGTYTTTTATDTFALGYTAAQAPVGVTGNAMIYTTLTGTSTAGSVTSTTATTNQTMLTGGSVSNVTNEPFSSSGVVQGNATTSGTFVLTGTLTGTTPSGTVNPGTTCFLY